MYPKLSKYIELYIYIVYTMLEVMLNENYYSKMGKQPGNKDP